MQKYGDAFSRSSSIYNCTVYDVYIVCTTSLETQFSPKLLILQMVNFKENFKFARFQGGGPTFSGCGGSNCLGELVSLCFMSHNR